MTSLPAKLPAFFWHFIKPYPWAFALLFASTAAHVLESNVLPYALKLMVDTLVSVSPASGSAYRLLAWPIGLFLGMWVLMILVWRAQEYVAASVFPRFQAQIRLHLFSYAQQHSQQFFSEHFAGNIASKIADLPRAMLTLIEMMRWRMLTAFWVTLVAVAWLWMVSPWISLTLAAWLAIYLSMSYAVSKRVAALSAMHAEDQTVLQGHVVDIITNMAITRLFARRAGEQRYVRHFQDVEQTSHRRVLRMMWWARLLFEAPTFLMFAGVLLLLVEGWKHGWATPGDVVSVMNTVFNVMWLTWMLGTELPQFFREIGVCRQALRVLIQPHGVADAPDAQPFSVTRGEIVFDNVHFHYVAGMDIFHNKSITLRAGEKVGLVGFSGSGKSTFVNLILRLYDVEGGRILIDGQDIAQVTQDSLRAAIAMIPQDTTLFHRTLMENIRYGRPEATDEEVIEASRQAHCHEFIARTENGYESLVGERGVKLSGGQRQRIAIARAILKNAPILILDEATSSLDSVTERCIQESLESLMRGRTTIVIAHRLSTLAHMQRILVFKEGEIIEDGTHEALLAAGGHYAMLWNMQAGGFLPESAE